MGKNLEKAVQLELPFYEKKTDIDFEKQNNNKPIFEKSSETIRTFGGILILQSILNFIPYLFSKEPEKRHFYISIIYGIIGTGTYIGGQLSEIRIDFKEYLNYIKSKNDLEYKLNSSENLKNKK